jgi:uncharacterized repeat protein (TIGR03806 family)
LWFVACVLSIAGCGSARDESAAPRVDPGFDATARDALVDASEADVLARADAGGGSDAPDDSVRDTAVDQGPEGATKDREAGPPPMPIPGTCTPPLDVRYPYEKLSQTGCVDANDPTKLAAKVIPYEVNSPLWSDNAAKKRGMVVPFGKTIHVKDCVQNPAECAGAADSGKWVLPVGTVMVKNFLFDDKLVETRLFVHFDERTWVGYGYRWDEAQTDATIVPDERVTIMFDTGKRTVPWTFPHRLDCTHCHAPEAGSTLGLETAQMNRVVNGKNQIDQIAALGLFENNPPKPYKAALVAPYAIPGQLAAPPATATIDERARSYLHANCGFCHRPGGAFEIIDLRYDVALKDRSICNTVPDKGDVGVMDAFNLAPGDPKKSTLWLRMNSLANKIRMPEIASAIVDQAGVDLIGQWITNIKVCPM